MMLNTLPMRHTWKISNYLLVNKLKQFIYTRVSSSMLMFLQIYTR